MELFVLGAGRGTTSSVALEYEADGGMCTRHRGWGKLAAAYPAVDGWLMNATHLSSTLSVVGSACVDLPAGTASAVGNHGLGCG